MAIDINDGVLPYLNASAGMHNGHDGKEFASLVKKLDMPQDGFNKVTVTAMAGVYGVSRTTMGDWIQRYKREHPSA